MKKVILGAVLAAAAVSSMNAQAAATAICGGGNAAQATVQPGTGSAGGFVKTLFTARCSNNVHLVGEDATTYYQSGATSIKGKNAFGASSAGGGVTGSGCASATGCVSNDAVTAAAATATS